MPVFFKQRLDRRDRAEAHHLRADRGDRRGDDPRARLETGRRGLLVAHHEQRRGAVVERAGVARGDRAALLEDGPQRGELLERRAGAGAVVLGDDRLGHIDLVALLVDVFVRGDGDGDDLLVEVARFLRGDRARLRDERPFVLGLAADFALVGDVLGGHAHRDVGVVQRTLGAVEQRMELERRALPGARDGLDAGGDVRVALAGLDRVEGHPRGLQRGGAEAVDGAARHVVVDAREQ